MVGSTGRKNYTAYSETPMKGPAMTAVLAPIVIAAIICAIYMLAHHICNKFV